MTKEELIEAIGSMTVLELADLVKAAVDLQATAGTLLTRLDLEVEKETRR